MRYPKTDNLYARDSETHLLTRELRKPEFGLIARWLVTEKIDGTNIRIRLVWRPNGDHAPTPHLEVCGRTDNASLPPNFVQEAIPDVTTGAMLQAFCALLDRPMLDLAADPVNLTIFGEGYGPGIQKNGGIDLAPKKSFRVFDVVTYRPGVQGTAYWRPWDDVRRVADELGLKTVPVIAPAISTDDVDDLVRDQGVISVTRGYDHALNMQRMENRSLAEGVVARTDPYLFDSRGNRVMFKLKTADVLST